MSHLQSEIVTFFSSMADRCKLAEVDFLFLASQDITTCQQFYYKVPSETALHDFIEDEIFDKIAERDPDNELEIRVRDHASGKSLKEFCRTNGMAALRRLWDSCKTLSMEDQKEMVALLGFCNSSFDIFRVRKRDDL